jgi:hypothetical protein
MRATSKIRGYTVATIDADGFPRLLASGLSLGAVPVWYPLDPEALASFTQREHPPWGHIWLSSLDLAEDAARATRGWVCVVEADAKGTITIRRLDPVAEAVAAEREACAMIAEAVRDTTGSEDSSVRDAVARIAAAIRARNHAPSSGAE